MFLAIARNTTIIMLILGDILKTTTINNIIKWILKNVLEIIKNIKTMLLN